MLQRKEGRRSQEFFVKREEHLSNKYKELETSSKATIEDLKQKLGSALNTINARDDEII